MLLTCAPSSATPGGGLKLTVEKSVSPEVTPAVDARSATTTATVFATMSSGRKLGHCRSHPLLSWTLTTMAVSAMASSSTPCGRRPRIPPSIDQMAQAAR